MTDKLINWWVLFKMFKIQTKLYNNRYNNYKYKTINIKE